MNGQAMGNQTVASTVALAGAGDEAAFARLVATYHADMARVAFAACGDRELAEDAVQSAWLVAWRKLHSLRDPARVRPWLLASATAPLAYLAQHRAVGLFPAVWLAVWGPPALAAALFALHERRARLAAPARLEAS